VPYHPGIIIVGGFLAKEKETGQTRTGETGLRPQRSIGGKENRGRCCLYLGFGACLVKREVVEAKKIARPIGGGEGGWK